MDPRKKWFLIGFVAFPLVCITLCCWLLGYRAFKNMLNVDGYLPMRRPPVATVTPTIAPTPATAEKSIKVDGIYDQDFGEFEGDLELACSQIQNFYARITLNFDEPADSLVFSPHNNVIEVYYLHNTGFWIQHHRGFVIHDPNSGVDTVVLKCGNSIGILPE